MTSSFNILVYANDEYYVEVDNIDITVKEWIYYGVDSSDCYMDYKVNSKVLSHSLSFTLEKYDTTKNGWNRFYNSPITEGMYRFSVEANINYDYINDSMYNNYRFVDKKTTYSINGKNCGTVQAKGNVNTTCSFYTLPIKITKDNTPPDAHVKEIRLYYDDGSFSIPWDAPYKEGMFLMAVETPVFIAFVPSLSSKNSYYDFSDSKFYLNDRKLTEKNTFIFETPLYDMYYVFNNSFLGRLYKFLFKFSLFRTNFIARIVF